MKSQQVMGDYYVGYTGPMWGIESTHFLYPKIVYGKVIELFETANFGWCLYEDALGVHLLCLG